MNLLTSHTSRRRAAIAAVGLASLIAPAAASADSIVYLDGGNVFSAHADGTAKVQLTDGGNWHSPTQSDDGTIAAVQGTGPIVVMARDGRPLRTITTSGAATSNGGQFAPRPVELSFSPDGSKIAYAYVQGSCPPASTCDLQQSTFYTASDVSQATPISTYGNQFGVHNPEWVTNTRTLVHGGSGSQVSIDDLGPGDYNFTPWITPNADMGDGEVSRDGKRLAVTFNYGENKTVQFLAVNGDVKTQTPPPTPSAACGTTTGDAKVEDPSWSPDASSVAFGASNGIRVVRFSEFAANHCVVASETTLSATGSDPDWGPADPPASRYKAQGPTGPTGPLGPAKSVLFKVAKPKASVRALRKGLTVRLTVRSAGNASAKLSFKGKRVASGHKTVKKAGRVQLRLSRIPARKARALRGKKLKLTIAFKPKGGRVTTATRSLKVR